MRCFEITPHVNKEYSSQIVIAGDTWTPAIRAVADALDSLYLDAKDTDEPWVGITVTVRCIEMTEAEFDAITDWTEE